MQLNTLLLLFATTVFINCTNRPNIAQTINDIRTKAQPELDSAMDAMAAQNRFFDSLKLLIKTKKLKEATVIVDSLIAYDPKEEYFMVLKGDIYDAKGLYDSAIYEYDMSMNIQTFPISLDARAKTYVKTGRYNAAIDDYKHAAEINYYYNIKLAQIFELEKQKDSALKYYRIYLERDPGSINIKQKVLLLQKS